MSFDYFYGQQSDLFTFYRVPKVLFTNERFWNISADAKMLYGILLDRMSLSAKNGWIDKNGRVYIIFTIDEAKMALNCAEQKAIKLLSELEKKAGLIERKRQGLGKPNLIYVKNFISAVDSQLLNCENHNSGTMEITTQELPKSQCNKTDRKMYVGGINCSKQNAYAEMIAVQRRFGLRGKVVGYHGIQSFKTGEVTPEQAFEIGKATARKMWGDRYQVLVTIHLNTDNVHCHFVVNPVSFKDGTKFQNKIGDHKELRKVSDAICREHGLSVLENSNFYGGHKKDYWRHKSGKKTHRDYLREDVEYCLSFATTPREFENQLYALGYMLDLVRFSVKAKHWERSVRLANIGFTKEIVQTLP